VSGLGWCLDEFMSRHSKRPCMVLKSTYFRKTARSRLILLLHETLLHIQNLSAILSLQISFQPFIIQSNQLWPPFEQT